MAKWFHTRVRKARELAGLSQAELASALEVTSVTISNWENRKSEPRGDQRARILDWLEDVEARMSTDRAPNERSAASSASASIQTLRRVYEHWPQSRIGEALGVSQMTVSNWLRTGNVNEKYAEALRRVLRDLEDDAESDASMPSEVDDDESKSSYGEWLRVELDRMQLSPVDLAQRAKLHINTILALLEGRTERPQSRTRDRISKALDERGAPSKEPLSEQAAWYYIGLPWTEEEIDQVPNEPGVYMIHDRLGRPAYVGVAHTGRGGIRDRLRKHNEARWTADRRVARSFSYALANRIPRSDVAQLAKAMEKLLIKFMGNAILINEKDVEDIAR